MIGRVLLLACLTVWAELSLSSGEEPAWAWPARTITLKKDNIHLSEALARLQEQTGQSVADRRLHKADPQINLDLRQAHFWPALEQIARLAGGSLSLYQQDGKVALVDGPYRAVPVSHHGAFRTAVKRLTLSRDLETGGASCVVHLETAWERWFQPFYQEVGPCRAEFSPGRRGKGLEVKLPSRGRVAIAGRAVVETPIRLPAPPRTAGQIDSLKGNFQIIGPTRMLTFRFEDLQPLGKKDRPPRKQQEGVTVSLVQVLREPDRWSFDVLIENPPGGPMFESYQSWLDNNRIYLEKGQGKGRQVFVPPGADEEQLEDVSATRAAIRYHFRTRDRNPDWLGKLEDWALVYTTPGRIVEITVPYSFQNLPLP